MLVANTVTAFLGIGFLISVCSIVGMILAFGQTTDEINDLEGED